MTQANQADLFGEGVYGSQQQAVDPDDVPNPANPGGMSNNRYRAVLARQAQTQRQGDPTLGYGGSAAQQAAARDANQRTAQAAVLQPNNSLGGVLARGAKTAGDIAGQVATPAVAVVAPGLAASGLIAQKTGNAIAAKAAPAGPAAAGPKRPDFSMATPPTAPPATPPPTGGQSTYQKYGQSGAPAPAAGGTPGWDPVTADTSRYDAAAQAIRDAQAVYQKELERLSGVDPFGNQAALQKATDRAVAQAAGTAAGARGGAAALAGAQRQAVGVQAQTAARGAQEMVETRRRDEQLAAQGRLTAAGGIMTGATQLAENEVQLADQYLKAAQTNLQAYLGGRELDQRETESLRNLSVELARIDQARYATDTEYRASVNAQLTEIYKADTALQGLKYQVDAGENLSADEWLMGLMGAGAGIATAKVKSDRRSKFDIHDPDLRDLQDYLGRTKGKLYRYKDPSAPGQRAGLNFGPMAQDLAKSKIGRTVVVEGKDGLYVDTGRLALADHAALAALAAEVEKLKGSSKK